MWRHDPAGYPRGASVFQRSDKKQQSTELVIGALVGTAMKAMDHIYAGAANGVDWSGFMLAILEFALFIRAERVAKQISDITPKFIGPVQGKQPKRVTRNRPDSRRRPDPIFPHRAPLQKQCS